MIPSSANGSDKLLANGTEVTALILLDGKRLNEQDRPCSNYLEKNGKPSPWLLNRPPKNETAQAAKSQEKR
jgi:hypothetical protein